MQGPSDSSGTSLDFQFLQEALQIFPEVFKAFKGPSGVPKALTDTVHVLPGPHVPLGLPGLLGNIKGGFQKLEGRQTFSLRPSGLPQVSRPSPVLPGTSKTSRDVRNCFRRLQEIRQYDPQHYPVGRYGLLQPSTGVSRTLRGSLECYQCSRKSSELLGTSPGPLKSLKQDAHEARRV